MNKTISLVLVSLLFFGLTGWAYANTTLPNNYPSDVLPLVADAKILDVRVNPANNGVEVSYVTELDIEVLKKHYESALSGGTGRITTPTSDGYMLMSKVGDVHYTVMLSKDALKTNPAYAGKNSVYIVITGLPGANAAPERPKEQGETWPAKELPGVPELSGVIDYLLVEAGGVYLEIIVENASVVKQYLDELQDAGFSFDEAPDLDSEHIQLLAFGETGILNFAYKAVENRVFIEFQK